MRGGEEERWAEEGDLVYVPSGALRGIENAAEGVLIYSAASPAMDAEVAYDAGRLREWPDEGRDDGRAHG